MTGLAKNVDSLTAKQMTTAYHVVAHGQNKIYKEKTNDLPRNRTQIRGCMGVVQSTQPTHSCRDDIPMLLQSRS